MKWLSKYYRNHMWFKQLVDQACHIFGAALILAPSVWGQFAVSALLIGTLREVEQMRAKAKHEDELWDISSGIGIIVDPNPWSWHWRRTLDVAFWVVGGGLLQWLT